ARAATNRAHQRLGNPLVVLGEVALGLAPLGEEHLVRMADQLAWHRGSPPRGSAMDRARPPFATATIMSSPRPAPGHAAGLTGGQPRIRRLRSAAADAARRWQGARCA